MTRDGAESTESGPRCPECGSGVGVEKNELTDEEHTHIMSCTMCGWEIETASNLVWEDRHD